jgi:hypothetical protein
LGIKGEVISRHENNPGKETSTDAADPNNEFLDHGERTIALSPAYQSHTNQAMKVRPDDQPATPRELIVAVLHSGEELDYGKNEETREQI